MAFEYYDDALAGKLMKWTPTNLQLRVLKPDDTKRLMELKADDSRDKQLRLPFIALSRNNEIELLLNVKNPRSFDGLTLNKTEEKTLQMNVIPVKLQYQLDIFAKTQAEAEQYVREYLFKLINNPVIKIVIPYNGQEVPQIANIKVLSNVADTSDIPQRLFVGQFTRWTIQLEILDAFLYNLPYRQNWKIFIDEDEVLDPKLYSTVEVAKDLYAEPEESELLPIGIKKLAKILEVIKEK